MTSLVQAIQKLIKNTINAMDITKIIIGIVENEKPLTIRIDPKLVLTEEYLYLTKNVVDHQLLIKYEEHKTEEIGDHRHSNGNNGSPTGDAGKHTHIIKATGEEDNVNSKIEVLNHLKKGDQVMMIQQYGAQKYIVLDKVYKPKNEEEE